MADSNAGWFPAAGGRLKSISHEPQRYHKTESTTRRRREPEPTREPTGSGPMPAVAEPRARTLDIEETSVYTPDITINIGGAEIQADRDIKIRASASGASTADIELYNVDIRTWAGITESDSIEVRLGWTNSASPVVFRGSVVTKRRGWRGADRKYVVRALATGGDILKRSDYSRTFNDLSPHRIIEYVIDDIGLGRGYISTLSDKLDGYYSITQHKNIREWLDDLAQKAANQTGLNWVWYVESGDLHFHPAVERTTQEIGLSTEKSLLRATPVGSPRDGRDHPYEIAMRCEPVIRRGLAVKLDGVPEVASGRRHRVKSYVFESSTITGRHHTMATITPLIERAEVYNARRS